MITIIESMREADENEERTLEKKEQKRKCLGKSTSLECETGKICLCYRGDGARVEVMEGISGTAFRYLSNLVATGPERTER
ncbi:unnamed protein product [Brugia pahangi]|uniref:Thyroglobulin type-1 domain-containing protein n=1 Tax=Brugia pahangi TaxID=6280 RepID=A0A0N4T6L8_BRUPA|nr:unnamed protein product [Brugia pahangi]